MKIQGNSNSEYGFVDIVKFLLALVIVSAHFVSENAVGRIPPVVDYISSVYVIVVPFFFSCSGFLLFRKMGEKGEWEKVKNYCKKILVMYAGWSIVYCTFKVLTWVRFGTTIEGVLHYLINVVTYSTYKTIWFLPATAIGVLLTYWFINRFGFGWTVVLGSVFYVIGCLGTSYSFFFQNSTILKEYNYFFTSSRNGVFNGFPFVLVGYLIAQKEREGFYACRLKNLVFTIVFGMAFVAEAVLIKIKFNAVNINTLFFLIPFTYFFLMFCLGVKIRITGVTIKLRRLSTDIFLCQRLFLSAIPELLPESFFHQILMGNPYVGLVYIIGITLLTAWGLILLSNKINCLKRFC